MGSMQSSSEATAPVLELECKANNYAWGKLGDTSAVAKLIGGSQEVDKAKPYAELWMGTHVSGPSYAKLGEEKKELSEVLGNRLPYLFKVLSINKCLSIQAHPNKELAGKLHKNKPKSYKDDNHKPEMACAVTRFEAMCGFRPLAEILQHLTIPEVRAVVSEKLATALEKYAEEKKEDEENIKAALREVFRALVTYDAKALAGVITPLIERLKKSEGEKKAEKKEPGRILDVNEIVLRLFSQYPINEEGKADCGVLAPYFLNCLACDPGEAIYLPANEPHAYMSGDIIECMASSDNVVRAGCTPKEKDVEILISMLTYNTGMPKIKTGKEVDKQTRMYEVPIDEFRLSKTCVSGADPYTLKGVPGAALILVYSGAAKVEYTHKNQTETIDVQQGTVLAVLLGDDIKITRKGDAPCVMFRCFSPRYANQAGKAAK